MSQQINLLQPRGRSLGAAAWALAAVGVVIVALLVYHQSLMAETGRLRETANAGQQKIDNVKSAIESQQKQRDARGSAASLAEEIAALRPRAEAVNQLLKELRGGSLGNSEGFSRYFDALGSVSEQGLWVTSVTVSNGGRAVSVSGRAMRNESVMQYARRLNDAFARYDVRFNSLELTPENLTRPAGAPVLTTMLFKLS